MLLMAIYNEILVARYASMIKKVFGMKGGNPTKQVAGEVIPVFPLFSGVENRFLETWTEWAGLGSQAALAANTSSVRLRNPLTSNTIVVLEKLAWGLSGQDIIVLRLGSQVADYATISAADNAIDGRIAPAQKPNLVISTAAPAVPFGSTIGNFASPTTGGVYDYINTENQELMIFPGVAIQIDTSAVNESLNVNLRWRERFLEESERQ